MIYGGTSKQERKVKWCMARDKELQRGKIMAPAKISVRFGIFFFKKKELIVFQFRESPK